MHYVLWDPIVHRYQYHILLLCSWWNKLFALLRVKETNPLLWVTFKLHTRDQNMGATLCLPIYFLHHLCKYGWDSKWQEYILCTVLTIIKTHLSGPYVISKFRLHFPSHILQFQASNGLFYVYLNPSTHISVLGEPSASVFKQMTKALPETAPSPHPKDQKKVGITT